MAPVLRLQPFSFLFSISLGWSQAEVSYSIDVTLNPENKQILVKQKVHIAFAPSTFLVTPSTSMTGLTPTAALKPL